MISCNLRDPFLITQLGGSGGIYTRGLSAVRCPLSYNISLLSSLVRTFMPNPFILKDAKYVLLTYSQVPQWAYDETSERYLPPRIVSLSSSLQSECIVARERHSDGGWHFHAFLDFGGRAFSTRDTRKFDIEGLHPNIERVGRTPWIAYDYACKDGDIVGGGGGERPSPSSSTDDSSGEPDESNSRAKSGTGNAKDWDIILASETRDDFFLECKRRAPKSLAINFLGLSKYADWRFRTVPLGYSHPENWTVRLDDYPVLTNWINQNLGE